MFQPNKDPNNHTSPLHKIFQQASPLVIAHRGGSLEQPENTLISLQHAIDCKSDLIEIDVQLTSDLVPVVFHDDTLERTTNGKGYLEEKSDQQLRQLSIVIPQTMKTFSSSSLTIPTLQTALSLSNSHFMLELKKTTRSEMLVEKTLQMIEQCQATQRVVIASFEVKILELCLQRNFYFPIIGIIETLADFQQMKHLELNGIVCNQSLVLQKPSHLKDLPKYPIWTHTAKTLEEAKQLINLGIKGIITDRPYQLRNYLTQLSG